ncbi:MAG: hypothetical protein LBB30_04155 [Candidatus Methanoplasma sp.]|jgi:hypothetical protein|nr:hypothetical protein [Candidatus Methanoplasma sp.]
MKKPYQLFYGGCLMAEGIIVVALALLVPRPKLELPPEWPPEMPEPDLTPLTTSPLVIAIGLGIGLAIILLFWYVASKNKNRLKEDEMTRDIAQRSAFYAFIAVVPQLFFAYYVLSIFDTFSSGWNYYVRTTLGFVGFSLMMIYSISYIVINRRMQKNG